MKAHGKIKRLSELIEVPPKTLTFELDLALLNQFSSSVRTKLAHWANDTELSPQDIYQRLKLFQECGVEFSTLDNNSCQLRYPLDLLDINKVSTIIPTEIFSIISSLERHLVIGSTNSTLINLPAEQLHAKVCLAEYQTAGRGRYGRQWVAPFASGLCLSLGWQFQKTVKKLQLISFLPAVALIHVLHKIGLKNAGVKWPNDVIYNGQKLAGILIEMPATNAQFPVVVIGIGLNVYNRSELSEQIPQPWTSIDQHLEKVLSRNELAALLITELIELIQVVEQEGTDKIRDEWRQYDGLKNTPVTVINGNKKEKGISRGINDDGLICIEIDGKLEQFVSGEISLRPERNG